jgi:hypothetical protein
MTILYERNGPGESWEYIGAVSVHAVAEEAVRQFRWLEALRSAPPMEYLLAEHYAPAHLADSSPFPT